MGALPEFTLDKRLTPHLSRTMREVGLDFRPVAPPKMTPDGVEEIWMCSDSSGQLFSFSLVELSDQNVFGLKGGTMYLQFGPREKSAPKRKRKEVAQAFERLERALVELGAQRIARR